MQLEWLGKYRQVVGSIVRFGNAYANSARYEHSYSTDTKFTPSEVHVLEYVLEHEEETVNMAGIADMIGISKAALSKNVKKMVEKGLLEKYKAEGNRKNIILRVSEYGRKAYEEYTRFAYDIAFERLFEKLKDVPDEYLDKFTEIMNCAAELTLKNKDPEKPQKLIKIE